MKNAKFIVNPSAGTKTVQRRIPGIINKLIQDGTVLNIDTFETTGQDDAYREAAALKKGQYDFIVAVGGDGTVNEVVNGLIESESSIPLAIIAAGTVNDFAHSVKLPHMINDFCEMIKGFKTIECDVGHTCGRSFLNVIAAGMMTDVAYKVPSNTKTVLGKMAYYLNGAGKLPSNMFKSIPLHFEYDGETLETDAFLFIAANSSSVGGFHKIAPNASISDGLLDVCIIKKLEALRIVPMFLKIPFGKHIYDKGIIYFQTKKFTVKCLDSNKEIPLDFDGEQYGKLPVTVENTKHAITLLVPSNHI